MVMAVRSCQFSNDGKYFAQIIIDGKLKVWNTLSNTFEQEFTPDFHLTAPCTCLHFVSSGAANKSGSPRKKKRRESSGDTNSCIALGTSSGRLLLYSLAKGDLDFVIDDTTSQPITCLSSNNDEVIYSGSDTSILVWNLYKRNVGKWVAVNEQVGAILVTPGGDTLLTASKSIKLWSITSKEVLKLYTGHSSTVTSLHYVSPRDSSKDAYFISGSKGDRLLSCWNLNENVDGKNAVASFLMEDIANNVSVYSTPDGSTNMAVTVRSGVVHVYQHALNGKKCNKPVKPKTTIQVVSDSQEKGVVSPIHITSAMHRDAETLCICHGNGIVQTFEDITVSTYKKLQCLLRQDVNKRAVTKNNQVSKVRAPVVGNDVHYLTTETSSVPTKRKNDAQQEVPMEKRLENLVVNETDSSSKLLKANNLSQLLVQGLHSKDKNILRTVLFKKDEQLIKNTIKRIPVSLITPLFEELTRLIQGKTLSRQIGLLWLKNLILIHSGLLLSFPDLPHMFGQALGSIEAGLALQTSRNKLMGRLELLVTQISRTTPQVSQDPQENEGVLIFNDKVSSDSDDGMEVEIHSSSENEWDEESSGEDNDHDESNNENGEESDEAMSA